MKAKKTTVNKVPITSVTALSEIIICLVDGFLKRIFFRTGIIAAGSVEARIAPNNTADIIDTPPSQTPPIYQTRKEKRKAVINKPTNESENIFQINFLKFGNGVSSPPENNIKVAPRPTIIPNASELSNTGRSIGLAANPKNIAKTKEGNLIRCDI